MTDIDELRRSLHELADEARPAPLGPAALRGARRRHRRRLVGVGMVLLLAAGVAVPLALENVRRESAAPVVDAPDGPRGPHVVSSYASGGKWFVLDPASGRYRQVDGSVYSVSPNLDRFASFTITGEVTELRIRSTSGEGQPLVLKFSVPVGGGEWSPDGAWMVVPISSNTAGAHKTGHGFMSVFLIDTVRGSMRRVNVDLGGRYGVWASWGDDDRTLLVGTEGDKNGETLSTKDGVARYARNGVAALRLDGSLIHWRALPDGGPCIPTGEMPTFDRGKLAVCVHTAGRIEFRLLDPFTDKPTSLIGGFAAPAEMYIRVVGWDGADSLVVTIASGDNHAVKILDARNSTLVPARLVGLPKSLEEVVVGSSDALSAAAIGRSF